MIGRMLIVLCFVFGQEVHAQLAQMVYVTDSASLAGLYRKAIALRDSGRFDETFNLVERALQMAMAVDSLPVQQEMLVLMGDTYYQSGDPASGIPYYLRAAGISESGKQGPMQLLEIYKKIAEAYRAEQVYTREMEYRDRILEILPEEARSERLKARSRLGSAAYHAGEHELAAATFRSLMQEYERGTPAWLNVCQDLVTTFDAASRYDSAMHYTLELKAVYALLDRREQVVRLTNNLGYYHTLLKDEMLAAAAYVEAIDLAQQLSMSPVEIAGMMSNAGVCFTNLGQDKAAIEYFNSAIDIYRNVPDPAGQARNENMLANVYHVTGDLYNAGLFSRSAIRSAEEAGDRWLEAQACHTYSRVLRDGNDPVNALMYYERFLSLRDSVVIQRQMEIQQLENKKNMLEQQERALRLRLKEDEVSELTIRQLKLQNEKMVQEQELLVQERSLSLLKQDSLRQSLIIRDQQYQVAQRERENRLLEQEKALSEMQLAEEVAKQKALEREKQLLEQQQRLDQLELERQKTGKQVLIGAVTGVGILMFLILGSLITTRRKNLLLAAQKLEIEEKNADLEQKNEEISTQRDEIEAQRNMVFEQKQAIEAYNDEIMKSIAYAQRLQTAALPAISLLREKVSDQFVYFRPRDVVSGDFYWFAEVEGKLVVTVADCTGHGVPGAFMSMMGMSLLKELVQKEYITHPGVVLRRMRKEIINAMGQKGVSGEQRDGMDMALISYDPEARKIDYAGAYNSLYLVRSAELPPPELEEGTLQADQTNNGLCLYEVPADKMPIAHFDRMDKFRNHEIDIHPGDACYLFTDGFADQFGGEKGKKFMYKPFKRLLLKNASKSMEEQYRILSQVMEDWMGDVAQVDDICVMGLRF